MLYDVAIIGGGINGCGIAREATLRGAKVFLCEQGDLAQATSSASTKLIHGGLRYLEHYEFRLVREALAEREVLWRMAPHIVRPMRFVLPHHPGLRPAWMLRMGLFLYDHLGSRQSLAPTRVVDMRRDATGKPLQPRFRKGFEYSDCAVDDARLTLLCAKDAAERGASVHTRLRCIAAERSATQWQLQLEDVWTGARQSIAARSVVNAAGPWVERVLTTQLAVNSHARMRLVRGSHIVVPRLFEHDRSYIFQQDDGRIVFAIPYEQDFTLIGTTDQDHREDLSQVRASPQEVDYLCAAASSYFAQTITPAQVVWSYSGVRPLYDDGASAAQTATRDYVLKLDVEQAPVLSIYGGKITTFRRLAQSALQELAPLLQLSTQQAEATSLPGGDFQTDAAADLLTQFSKRWPFADQTQLRRWLRLYGTRTERMLGDARCAEDLGQCFGAGLTEREVRYLIREEWAVTAEDVLWRRSKLGLRLQAAEVAALETWMETARSTGCIANPTAAELESL